MPDVAVDEEGEEDVGAAMFEVVLEMGGWQEGDLGYSLLQRVGGDDGGELWDEVVPWSVVGVLEGSRWWIWREEAVFGGDAVVGWVWD